MLLIRGLAGGTGLTGTLYEPGETPPSYRGAPDVGAPYVWVCDEFYAVETGGMRDRLVDGAVPAALRQPSPPGDEHPHRAAESPRAHIPEQGARGGVGGSGGLGGAGRAPGAATARAQENVRVAARLPSVAAAVLETPSTLCRRRRLTARLGLADHPEFVVRDVKRGATGGPALRPTRLLSVDRVRDLVQNNLHVFCYHTPLYCPLPG